MVSTTDPKHSLAPTGILLANTGTPEAPSPKAVRSFLAEFLADRRVVRLPRWVWLPILHLIILNTRPRHSVKLYRQIWSETGSPLLHNTQAQAIGLREQLADIVDGPIQIQVGMRYGTPSISSALKTLYSSGVQRLLVLPLFPQYSQTTSASILDAVQTELERMDWAPEMRYIESYFDHPAYINALMKSIQNYWQEYGKPERLLFTYHGIPQSYALNGDPYPRQCHVTSSLAAEALGLESEMWRQSFQSRFLIGKWLQPYTNETLQSWGQSGVDDVQVVAPGFSSDCLETLSELAIEAKKTFIGAGGQRFGYIPALNDQKIHFEALADIVVANMDGWLYDHELQSS